MMSGTAGRMRHTSSSSSFFALELPLGSCFAASSSSTFFSFFAPPPNMEKTESFTPAAAALALLATLLAAAEAVSVAEELFASVAGASLDSSPIGFVANLVSSAASLGSLEGVWSAEGFGLVSVASDIMCLLWTEG
jgi:hypothetical protein